MKTSTTRAALVVGTILVAGLAAAIVAIRFWPAAGPVHPPSVKAARPAEVAGDSSHVPVPRPASVEPPAMQPAQAVPARPSPGPAPFRIRPGRVPRLAAATPAPAAPLPEPAASDDIPLPRLALQFVGADPEVEWIWVQAINDPTLSAHDRKDLIEDLNEEGFDDPRNLTPDDLPLIVNRLVLIEQLAPDAMDDVNAAAFAEAYKDLGNMYARLAQP